MMFRMQINEDLQCITCCFVTVLVAKNLNKTHNTQYNLYPQHINKTVKQWPLLLKKNRPPLSL